jgi:hypothetical protein
MHKSRKVIPMRQPIENYDLTRIGDIGGSDMDMDVDGNRIRSDSAGNGSPGRSSSGSGSDDEMDMDSRMILSEKSTAAVAYTGYTGYDNHNHNQMLRLSSGIHSNSNLSQINTNTNTNVVVNTNQARIGSNWSVAIQCFKQSGSVFECIGHLRNICDILSVIDRKDRIKYCKSDFDEAVKFLQKKSKNNNKISTNKNQNKFTSALSFTSALYGNSSSNAKNTVYNNNGNDGNENSSSTSTSFKFKMTTELFKEITMVIKRYFNINTLRLMPHCILFEIFSILGVDEFSVYSSTCSEWNTLASKDEVWRRLYHRRFTRSNPTSVPAAIKGILNDINPISFKDQFQSRLRYPELGDKVEVSWRGKFRLEARDVYQGLAWWVAEVVERHIGFENNEVVEKYKIRYPGWEPRWDEWVERDRLRWAVESNTICQIRQGDVVELWCCGANVPGAWLESRVKKIRDGRYCVNRVLTTGTQSHSRPLWAGRERLRLVKHPVDLKALDCSSGTESYEMDTNSRGRSGRSRSRFGSFFTDMFNMIGGGGGHTNPNSPNNQNQFGGPNFHNGQGQDVGQVQDEDHDMHNEDDEEEE